MTSHSVECPACCPTENCCDCCDGGTPDQITVTISGVNDYTPPGFPTLNQYCSLFNGTWVLDRICYGETSLPFGDCDYNLSDGSPTGCIWVCCVDEEVFPNSTCPGTAFIFVRLNCVGPDREDVRSLRVIMGIMYSSTLDDGDIAPLNRHFYLEHGGFSEIGDPREFCDGGEFSMVWTSVATGDAADCNDCNSSLIGGSPACTVTT